MTDWLTDTPTSERFPLFTRANADEVGPLPFPPLTWSLAWERGAVPGTVDAWVHLGGFRREEFREPVAEVYGCWGGYLYNQVSVGRVFGLRAPGAQPDDIDRTYFGSDPQVPRYVPDPRDEDASCSDALAATLTAAMSSGHVSYAEDFLAQVRAWSAERPSLTEHTDAELVADARQACERLRRAWDVYIQVVISASVGPGTVHAIATALGRADAAVGAFTALGDVESAETNRQVWALSRLVSESASLTGEFDAGTTDLLDRLAMAQDPDAHAFVARLRDFLADYGHRSPNEYDLASHTWAARPVIVLEMIGRIRHQHADQSPQRRAAAGATHREKAIRELESLAGVDSDMLATLRAGISSGQLFYRLRESCKDALVRTVDGVRRPVAELGERLARRGSITAAEHLYQALDSELDAVVASPEQWRTTLAQRATEFAELADRTPPYLVMHGEPVPPIADWPARGAGSLRAGAPVGTTFSGVGASPGVVTGTARVVRDLGEVDELDPGEILVCAVTDPSWAPLLMAAGAVVCQVGAEGSHAAIVSRELGVPCVMSVRGALDSICTGQQLEVDGAAGTVTVVGT